MTRIARDALVLLLVAVTSACALSLHHSRIADLKQNPAHYQNHPVSIDGIVTASWGIPLAPFRMYKVDDGTGEVAVISQGSRVPTRGARVHVTGRLDEVAVLGGQAVGLHIREEKLQVKR